MRRLGFHGARAITRVMLYYNAPIFKILALDLRPRRAIPRALSTLHTPYLTEILHQNASRFNSYSVNTYVLSVERPPAPAITYARPVIFYTAILDYSRPAPIYTLLIAPRVVIV